MSRAPPKPSHRGWREGALAGASSQAPSAARARMTHRDARLFLELTLERSPEEGIRTPLWVPQEAALRPPPAGCVTAAIGGGGGDGTQGRPRQSYEIPPTSFQKATEGSLRQTTLLRVSPLRDGDLWQWVTDDKNHKADLWGAEEEAGEEDTGHPAGDLVREGKQSRLAPSKKTPKHANKRQTQTHPNPSRAKLQRGNPPT